MTCWCACTVRARQMSASGRRPPGGGSGCSWTAPRYVPNRLTCEVRFATKLRNGMISEDTLAGWTGPSSATEEDMQDRTERMIREAVDEHTAFDDCELRIFAKGSYANNTNVRTDSDVDIAVECTEVEYWDEAEPGAHKPGAPYTGAWTPAKLRAELTAALGAKFPNQVDVSGSVALQVHASSARIDADVVPCFSYSYHFKSGPPRLGTKLFTTSGRGFENFPEQHLENGREKNKATGYAFKRTVRILKRVANEMFEEGYHREVPSYFVECLVYECPNGVFNGSSWTETVTAALVHIWDGLQGKEPEDDASRWLEVNECFYLFHSGQKWTRRDGRDFSYAAWNYLGLAE